MAISYGNIVNEANLIASLSMSGGITFSISDNVYSQIKESAEDSGRNAAYNATRKVIDGAVLADTSAGFFSSGASKPYVKELVCKSINIQLINVSTTLQRESGRHIFINGANVASLTSDGTAGPLTTADISINESDPYGFSVTINEGLNLTTTYNNQSFSEKTPKLTAYVSIEGLEDPYHYMHTEYRQSTIIYASPYYKNNASTQKDKYNFNSYIDGPTGAEYYQNLADCMNGSDNPGNFTPRSYYFPDGRGLSFFERLEGQRNAGTPNNTRLSSFVLNDPLAERHFNKNVSIVDWEYFNETIGEPVIVNNHTMRYVDTDVYLSNDSMTTLGLV